MQDFRLEFYKKYQSSFKQHINNKEPSTLSKVFKYLKYKYLPLVRNYNLDSSILDLGCGSGTMMQFLKESGFKNIEGIDISDEQINLAKSLGLNVKLSDAIEYLESAKTFDIIFVLDFIEHFNKEELLNLMDKIFKHINPGGTMIIRTPNGNGIYPNKIIYGDLTHLTIFNSSSLLQLLQLVGFVEINFFETGPIPKNLKGTLGFILWNFEKLVFNFFRYIEVGETEKYLTQEFICVAVKSKNL